MVSSEAFAAERRRLQYLEAMGIDCYVPRQALPGALPSVAWEMPAASTMNIANNVAADKSALLRLQQDLGAAQQKTSAAARQAVNIPAPNGTPVNTASMRNVLQFQLAIFQPVQELLVLVPAQHTDTVHLQLLKNILLAIAVKTNGLVPADNFAWPPRVSATVKINPTLEAAQETLHSLLEGYQLKSGIKSILVFAGDLASSLFPVEVLDNPVMKKLGVLCLPDLQQMLEDSQYKKITWQKVRHLGP